MRLTVAGIGKLKGAEERGLCERYIKRLSVTGKQAGLGPLDIIEMMESRSETADARKEDEAQRLLKATSAATLKIALDEKGRALSSDDFARLLSKHADAAVKHCAFLIGGPDGHGGTAIAAADITLSLGPLTLPHGLARVVLLEQLYRAATILAGHPYHRS